MSSSNSRCVQPGPRFDMRPETLPSARMPSVRLTARYLGFRAGFAYLDGWPWPMPRRQRSRNLVPGGSFAVGGAMAGFYPLDLPGGWNVLGRTAEQLANAISPGDEIA